MVPVNQAGFVSVVFREGHWFIDIKSMQVINFVLHLKLTVTLILVTERKAFGCWVFRLELLY